jgi:hypothetical protein
MCALAEGETLCFFFSGYRFSPDCFPEEREVWGVDENEIDRSLKSEPNRSPEEDLYTCTRRRSTGIDTGYRGTQVNWTTLFD